MLAIKPGPIHCVCACLWQWRCVVVGGASLVVCQVHGYSGAKYKSFFTLRQAQEFAVGKSRIAKSMMAASDDAGRAPTNDDDNGHSRRKRCAASSEEHTTTTTTTRGKKRRTTEICPSTTTTKTTPTTVPYISILFDGGARGNPGVAGAGAAITCFGTTLHRKTIHVRHFVGVRATNNQAEYHGVIVGLAVALEQIQQQQKNSDIPPPTIKLIVQGDSHLIIQQLRGEYQVKSKKLKPLYARAQQLLTQIQETTSCSVVLEHVYRSDNKLADSE